MPETMRCGKSGSILMGVKDTDTDTELEIYHVNTVRSRGMPN